MTAPSSIAHYKIIAKLGEGGMGAVYRATDTRLNRDVAIKVLPAGFAEDAGRMARFEREAQVLASLNHPNIAAIYGIEAGAIVMELVEGADLAVPVPVETAIAYARQIAAGLEAAHEKGIVHRDLKPANIKVTPDGTVKLLDFGLAKATDTAPSGSATQSPTMSLAMTQAGVILGTAAYMSPEQARGKPVDKRADIWSFGVVLYELLTGSMLFGGGETVSDSLAAVITKEPDWKALPKETPAHVRRLLERCLRKDPRQRMRDIGEARLELEEAEPAGPVPVAVAAPRRSAAPWAIVCGALTIALVFTAWRATRPAPLMPLVRVSVNVPPGFHVDLNSSQPLDISPDGSRLAVALENDSGKTQIYTRLLGEPGFTPVSGTEGAGQLFFSPDGQWLGFFSILDTKFKKVSLAGGAALSIADAQQQRGAVFDEDGSLVLASGSNTVITRIPTGGGAPVPLTKFQGAERLHRWPQILPGGKAILFMAHSANTDWNAANIEVQVLATGERKTVVRGAYAARYAAGYLLHKHQNTVFAAPFSLERLAVTGPALPVVEGILGNGGFGSGFAVAGNGTLVSLAGTTPLGIGSIFTVDESGKKTAVAVETAQMNSPTWSPDGKRLVYALSTLASGDLWMRELNREAPSRLTFATGPQFSAFPVWTPDGRTILFGQHSAADGRLIGVWWLRSDSTGEAKALAGGEGYWPSSVSPDGKWILLQSVARHIYLAPIEGLPGNPSLGKAERYAGTPDTVTDVSAAFSPDGRWIAYASNESGTSQIYVRPFPGTGGRRQISTAGGVFPKWSQKELFYRTLDRRIVRVEYTATGGVFNAGQPRPWSDARTVDRGPNPPYDVSPDGKLVAGILRAEAEEKPLTEINVLLNFFDELKRRIP